MSAVFKPDETFRGDFTFRNSPQAIRRFPAAVRRRQLHVFGEHRAASAGPAGSVLEFAFDVDEHYVAECRERAIVLEPRAAALSGAAAHDERAVGLPRAHHGIPRQRLSGAFLAHAAGQSLALDQSTLGHRTSPSSSAMPRLCRANRSTTSRARPRAISW